MSASRLPKILIGIGIGLFFLFLYWYKLPQSLPINTDYGKDIYAIAKISRGHFSLLGPALSIGIFAGPYYYYLMVPALLLSGLNPYSLAFTSVVLFSLSLSVTFFFFNNKYSMWKSALATFTIGISPLFIMASREPANGLTYLPLLLLFICLAFFKEDISIRSISGMGLLAGIILNFDTVAVLAIVPLSVYLFVKLGLKKSIIFAFFVLVTYLPLFAFEVKNNFVITKGIFIYKNYRTFVNNSNVVGAVSGNPDFIKNYPLISGRIFRLIGITPFLSLLLTATVIFRRQFFNSRRLNFFLITVASLILTVTLARYKLEIHYLFPVSLLLIFILTEAVISTGRVWFILIIPAIFLLGFPIDRYQPTQRTFSMFQDAVDYTISHHLVDKITPFDLIAITDPHLYVPIGNEYRFSYLKKGITPLNEYQFSQSQVLIVFSEIGEFDITHIRSWETDQFGSNSLKNYREFHTDRVVIYRVEK